MWGIAYMKLHEIKMVSDQTIKGFSLSDINLESGVQIGTAENIPLWKYTARDPHQNAYALRMGDEFVAIIVGTPHKLDKPYLIIQRTWTNPKYRGNGYAPALYVALVRKFHLALISDAEQSPGGRKIWDTIRSMVTVRMFDNETRQFVTDISDQELYSTERYRLIAESTDFFDNILLKESGKYVDDQLFERYLPTILNDYYIFTEELR
jgi:hypothetical protein